MKLIVGLGNPGSQYDRTRHNIGCLVLDSLIQKNKNKWAKGKGPYRVNAAPVANGEIILAKPMVYMNESGVSIKALCEHFRIRPQDCLIVSDDVNLPLGKIRFRSKGSSGGHHGLGSIIGTIQSEDFPRLRLGVGAGDLSGQDLTHFVLEEFSKTEWETVLAQVEKAAQACLDWVKLDPASLMQRYNS